MAKAKAVTVTKVKKKTWHDIVAPVNFKSMHLGETYVAEPENTIGKVVHVNLKNVTGNLKDQHVYLKFRVIKLSGTNLETDVMGYYLTPSSIKKLSRRNTLRLDDSFVVKTSDDRTIRVKPIAVTISKVPRSIGSRLLRAIRDYLATETAKLKFDDFIGKVIDHSMQVHAKKNISKVYPLKHFEIKVVEFAKEGKVIEGGKESPEDKPKKEKKTKKPKKTVTEEMQEELDKPESSDSEDFGEESK